VDEHARAAFREMPSWRQGLWLRLEGGPEAMEAYLNSRAVVIQTPETALNAPTLQVQFDPSIASSARRARRSAWRTTGSW